MLYYTVSLQMFYGNGARPGKQHVAEGIGKESLAINENVDTNSLCEKVLPRLVLSLRQKWRRRATTANGVSVRATETESLRAIKALKQVEGEHVERK